MHYLFLVLLSTALAAPTTNTTSEAGLTEVQEHDLALTDDILFTESLPDFLARREKMDPDTYDWSSDGCSYSPDNPFGFPFEPACQRHDFGYRNYKIENRFTSENRKKIDDNFSKDLQNQCSTSSVPRVCRSLANVYYWAVRAFGGLASRKRDEGTNELMVIDSAAKDEYDKALAEYEQAVKEAQEQGALPVLDNVA
ncbi:hypothetical protein CDD82_2377 [Ophiocordyceps australis]|uniref:Phospholipase A2 n=1 Tax=Ophiocordyceps australis TaxID=1399860 RepID=A0A2C5YMZ6_9HYPO|nr:hypothetical protein CDD82_2377 [Ophiocordyceps australis]